MNKAVTRGWKLLTFMPEIQFHEDGGWFLVGVQGPDGPITLEAMKEVKTPNHEVAKFDERFRGLCELTMEFKMKIRNASGPLSGMRSEVLPGFKTNLESVDSYVHRKHWPIGDDLERYMMFYL